jgi:uncharacterized protein YecE (DUF72 family)
MRVHVGVSGWQYRSWRGDFYPPELPTRRWLEYVADRFDTVELNASFYSLQRPESYRRWREQTPQGFTFAVKGGRFITHLKRLRDVETGLANFFASGVLTLGDRLGPILWQLPASLTFDERLIHDFVSLLPRTTGSAAELARAATRRPDRVSADPPAPGRLRHALEVRHASYLDDRFFELLARADIANVVSDSPSWPLLTTSTTDVAYVRLHGHSELYASGYAAASLATWAQRCRDWSAEGREVFVYFDNDARGRAPHDSQALAALLAAGPAD